MRLIVRKEPPPPRRPAPRHRRRRHVPDLTRRQHPRHRDRRARTVPPPVHPLRGPHPGRPPHRPAQPPLPRFRTEPDLAGDRPARPGPARLDAMLALTGKACRWEPKRLRLRLFSAAAQTVTTGRRSYLRFAEHWPWTDVATAALTGLWHRSWGAVTKGHRSVRPCFRGSALSAQPLWCLRHEWSSAGSSLRPDNTLTGSRGWRSRHCSVRLLR